MPAAPEGPEDFHARLVAAADADGRLPVAVAEMPGWDGYPFEVDSLRIKALRPLAAEEPPRHGEDPAACWCTGTGGGPDDPPPDVVWSNERWRVQLLRPLRLPVVLGLEPLAHADLAGLPDDLAAEMGRLVVALAGAVEALPSVARAHVARYGDGGAHLHVFVLGRPARVLQMRGSPLLDWEENLPVLPDDVAAANAAFVVERFAARVGGRPTSPPAR